MRCFCGQQPCMCRLTYVIYKLTCRECHRSYIGKTIRQLWIRIAEHMRAVRRGKGSALARHPCTEGYTLRVCARSENNPIALKIMEGKMMNKYKPWLNIRNEKRARALAEQLGKRLRDKGCCKPEVKAQPNNGNDDDEEEKCEYWIEESDEFMNEVEREDADSSTTEEEASAEKENNKEKNFIYHSPVFEAEVKLNHRNKPAIRGRKKTMAQLQRQRIRRRIRFVCEGKCDFSTSTEESSEDETNEPLLSDEEYYKLVFDKRIQERAAKMRNECWEKAEKPNSTMIAIMLFLSGIIKSILHLVELLFSGVYNQCFGNLKGSSSAAGRRLSATENAPAGPEYAVQLPGVLSANAVLLDTKDASTRLRVHDELDIRFDPANYALLLALEAHENSMPFETLTLDGADEEKEGNIDELSNPLLNTKEVSIRVPLEIATALQDRGATISASPALVEIDNERNAEEAAKAERLAQAQRDLKMAALMVGGAAMMFMIPRIPRIGRMGRGVPAIRGIAPAALAGFK